MIVERPEHMSLYLGVVGAPAAVLRQLTLFPAGEWKAGGQARALADDLLSLVKVKVPGQLDAVRKAVALLSCQGRQP